jgi:hypothetical protein
MCNIIDVFNVNRQMFQRTNRRTKKCWLNKKETLPLISDHKNWPNHNHRLFSSFRLSTGVQPTQVYLM